MFGIRQSQDANTVPMNTARQKTHTFSSNYTSALARDFKRACVIRSTCTRTITMHAQPVVTEAISTQGYRSCYASQVAQRTTPSAD